MATNGVASKPPVMTTAAQAEPDGKCPMCAHPLDAHDATGRRFCAATAAGALTRGCVCRL